jgi:uncharacterized protein YkwD
MLVPRPSRALIVAALAVGLSAAPAQPALAKSKAAKARTAAVCADANLVPASANLARISAATLCLVNQQRTSRGLVALRVNTAMVKAATNHSLDMVARNYFDHTSPTGETFLDRLRAAGYIRPNSGYSIAENIAAGTGSYATPSATVTMWMNSAGHRANILNGGYRDTGIGLAAAAPAFIGTGPGGTYTQEFGTTS